jgi:coenzyme PQQ precursor peptide PqqA
MWSAARQEGILVKRSRQKYVLPHLWIVAALYRRFPEGKEVSRMNWITPDFEEVETEAEVTAYADHW